MVGAGLVEKNPREPKYLPGSHANALSSISMMESQKDDELY
jgi:hypothetical protein